MISFTKWLQENWELIKPGNILPSEKAVKIKRVCPELGNFIAIDARGNMTTCCIDSTFKNYLGNINKITIKKVLNSMKLKRWILAQKYKNWKKMAPSCKTCNFYKEFLKKMKKE